MLKRVELKERRFEEYRGQVPDALFSEVRQLAGKLKGARVLHVNATSAGGGVAEILRSELPLLQDLGLAVSWQVLEPQVDFFTVTKQIHNGLQGDAKNLSPQQWQLYEDYNRELAGHIDAAQWDFIKIHDPQPAAALEMMPIRQAKVTGTKWIWRCHIDSKHANPSYRDRFVRYLAPYDGLVFTMRKYLLEGLEPKKLAVIPMAIDPLADKNRLMDPIVAREIVRRFGIDPDRPLVCQVSRFDPWKDPLGVIEAWTLARREVPGLQLALVGDSSSDDPEGAVVLERVSQAAEGKADLFVLADRADDRAVRAFQTHADVIIQKSLREGFGLTVTEALWAGRPVIGTDVGGIPLQVEDGRSGYLISGPAEAAKRTAELIKNPQRAAAMGRYGHDSVKAKFLTPRLIRDDLKFMLELAER